MTRVSLPRPFASLRIPPALGALILATALVSIAGAVAARNGAPGLVDHGILFVPAVWHGELWRLLTWVLYELEPIGLVFACLTLYWVGGDLARRWGSRRLVLVYFGLAAGAGVITCLIGRLLWPAVAALPRAGSWPVLDGLIIAWGMLHPGRAIRLWGLVQLTGRQIVWVTVAGTVLYALFAGLAAFIPHFAAELIVLAWLGARRRLRPGAGPARRAKAWSFDDWLARNNRH
jgi:membrane associated rhomboid family serine protease